MRKRVFLSAILLMTAGCGGPSVVYHIDDPDLQKSPPVGSVTFALRTTNITITATANGTTQNDVTPGVQPQNTNGGNNASTDGHGGTNKTAKKPGGGNNGNNNNNSNTSPPNGGGQDNSPTATALKVADICGGTKDSRKWQDCFGGRSSPPKVTFPALPDVSSDHVYIAAPNDDFLQLHQTTLSVTAKTDPLMPNSVTVHYNDRTKDVVSSVGTGITAGAAFGPFGMAAGGLGGLLNFALAGAEPKDPNAPWKDNWETVSVQEGLENFICTPSVGNDVTKLNWQPVDADHPALKLELPIVISLDETVRPGGSDTRGGAIDPKTGSNNPTPDSRQCWNLLPQHANTFDFVSSDRDDRPEPYWGNGWLYQIKLDPVDAKSTVRASDYFTPEEQGGSVTAGRSDFPASACRKGHLHILWWRALNGYLLDRNLGNEHASYTYLSVPVEVADPTYVVAAPLPRAGDIVFGDVCGAHTAPAADNNPGPGDVTNEIFKQIKAVKDSQKSTSSQTTKPATH